MDEDQPATQPRLSPAGEAAQEEARLKTADDSFVTGQHDTASTAPGQTDAPTLSAAKKVVIQPVNDLSSYSTAPAIPVATVQSSGQPNETGAVVAPQAPPTSGEVPTPTQPPVQAVAPTASYTTTTPSYSPDTSKKSSSYQLTSLVSSDIPALRYFAIGLLIYGLYYFIRMLDLWMKLKGYLPISALVIVFYMPSVLGIGYALYYFFAKSLRNASGVLLSQVIIQLQSLSLFLPSAFSGGSVNSSRLEVIAVAFIVIGGALYIRSQVNALDDASRNV